MMPGACNTARSLQFIKPVLVICSLLCCGGLHGSVDAAGSQATAAVVTTIIPAPGASTGQAAEEAQALVTSLSGLSNSFIVITPDGSAFSASAGTLRDGSNQGESSYTPAAPVMLQHAIKWDRGASAAANAAMKVAEASGAAWLFLATAGDRVTLYDSAAVQQQLAVTSRSVLFCRQSTQQPEAQACLFKLPLQGQFQGPVKPVYIPSTCSNSTPGSDGTSQADSSRCSSSSSRSSSSAMSVHGLTLLPAATSSYASLEAQVTALRRYLNTNPANKAWWLLQLAKAFDALNKQELAQQHFNLCYEASTSRRLAAWAMYSLAELHLRGGDYAGSYAAAAQGLARHTSPELLWLTSLAAYRNGLYESAVSWAEMAASLGCCKQSCDVERPAAFVDFAAWYEKPYDVLRFAHMQLGRGEAAQEATARWQAAEQLRKVEVQAGSSNGTLLVAGLQWLALHAPDEDVYSPPAASSKPRIAASITTAHRPSLFRRAWHSFRARCLDCDALVEHWYAVDDGSSPEDLAAMQRTAPSCVVTWLDKTPEQAGHVGSLNRILDEVYAQGFDYLLHFEDDWHFLVDEEFVSKALQIMDHDKAISQVLFNKNYADTDAAWEIDAVASGELLMTPDGLQYIQHVYPGPSGSPEHTAYVAKHAGGKPNNFHWPGFSLRPGLWRLSAIKQIGKFQAGNSFEEAFARKVHSAGFKTAFFTAPTCVHLAPTATWLQGKVDDINAVYERHGLKLQHAANHRRSAYDSNLSWR